MISRTDAQSPISIHLSLLVNDNFNSPSAPYLRDPFIGRGPRGVRDGDAVQVWVLVGDAPQLEEGLLGD